MGELRVKICGLTRLQDARAAAEAGADYLGVVVVPETPRTVTPADARRIRGDTGVTLALVSADRPPERLARDAETAGAGVLQLHGTESPDDVRRLRDAGEWTIWKSVRVREPADVEEALLRFGELVDGLHLDAWHPRRIGGTGVRFPWEAVRELRHRVPDGTDVVAAGGLDPDNVAEAIAVLRPEVVDVSSGVERAPGVKDGSRIRAFVRAVRAAGSPDEGASRTPSGAGPDPDGREP